jgi:hypothetical protein
MPGTKSRTVRRKKRWARGPSANRSTAAISTPTSTPNSPTITPPSTLPVLSSPSTSEDVTASKKKLSMSPYTSSDAVDDDSGSSSE